MFPAFRISRRLAALIAGLVLTTAADAHVVKQIFAKFTAGADKWQADVTMDAGYAWPEYRDDPNAPQPTLEWLESRPPKDFAILRRESEALLRRHLEFRGGEIPLTWTSRFPDFDSFPPDFPEITGGGAFLTVRIEGPLPPPGTSLTVKELTGQLPDFVFQTGVDQFPTLEPGKALTLFQMPQTPNGPAFLQWVQWGFTRLVLGGWTYVLFIIAMTLPDRRPRSLVKHFLSYLAGSSLAMALVFRAGVFPSPAFIQPFAALCIAAVAADNGWTSQPRGMRLSVMTGLSFVQGLSLAQGLQPASSSASLISSMTGVLCAVAVILLLSAMLMQFTVRKSRREIVARDLNLMLLLAGLALCAQRMLY